VGVSVTDRPTSTDSTSSEQVFCRRLERPLTISEHLDCLYCFGNKTEVRTADHDCFCDFEPGKDPINFGFPEGYGR